MKRFFRPLLLLLLAAMMAFSPLSVLAEEAAEENEAPITHTAIARVALRVRRAPSKDASAGDSIPRDSFVYILELGLEWCKVRTSVMEGYVLTEYLDDLTIYDLEAAQANGTADLDLPVADPVEAPGFTTSPDNFYEGYYAYAVKNAIIYQEPNELSRKIGNIPMYDKLIVSEVSGEWCLGRYENTCGYIRTSSLFKWDRIDPYVGEIPGLDIMPYLAFVNHTTTIYSMEDDSVLKTINPGAAIAVFELDEEGRYPLPYWRTTGYIKEEDVAWIVPVKDWESAESGDLISTMSTYYAVGISTLQYQGRNWNIRLSSSMITGTILQPGEEYNQHQTIGPFSQSTGYHKAPIMKKDALWGYGGGTCQVNTTFYIATIQLPLLVTHRKVHADVGIYYAKKGFDAAVGGGDINLTMVNTMPYAIRYQMFVSDGIVTCCIYKV